MNIRDIIIIIQILINLIIFIVANIISQEEARGVVFPPATVLQFAVGLAVPAQVPNRSVTTNLGTISNIPLPSMVRDLYPYYKEKRRMITHNYFYEILKEVFTSYDLDGKECVLKTICQMSSVDVDRSDLIQEILEYLFVPSVTKNSGIERDYLQAEEIGRDSKLKCSEEFSNCDYSLVDLITEQSLGDL